VVVWVKLSVTMAGSLRVKEKVVPTGGPSFCLLLLSRQVAADWGLGRNGTGISAN
jgi:hypothetical protein